MSNKLFFIAGPCVVEDREMLFSTAEELRRIADKYEIKLYLKASYRKANRTSINSFTGIGDQQALEIISEAGNKFELQTLTDIHTAEEAKMAANYVDVLQIPAFLSRQTELLLAAAETGKIINIKKAQFMAPADVIKAAGKVASTGNKKIWLTERGTFFGYNNLVVDYRSLLQMRESGHPVIYDATHSVQRPSIGDQSGGNPEYIIPLAKAAVAIGIDGVFFETHPNPKEAKSDAASQLPLDKAEQLIKILLELDEIVKKG